MKIFQASRSLAALTKQFAAAGLNIDDFIDASDETALQAHVESMKTPAPAPAPQVDVEKARKEAAAPYAAALEKFGVKITAADPAKGPTEAEILTPLEARASIKAADQLARHGLPKALDLAPAADPTKTGPGAAAEPISLAEFNLKTPSDKLAFSKAGGRIAG